MDQKLEIHWPLTSGKLCPLFPHFGQVLDRSSRQALQHTFPQHVTWYGLRATVWHTWHIRLFGGVATNLALYPLTLGVLESICSTCQRYRGWCNFVSYIIVRELQWNLSKADTIATLRVHCGEVSVLRSQVWFFVLGTKLCLAGRKGNRPWWIMLA